jgi:hypothetical protein
MYAPNSNDSKWRFVLLGWPTQVAAGDQAGPGFYETDPGALPSEIPAKISDKNVELIKILQITKFQAGL